MRMLARISCTLAGLALAAPAGALAGDPHSMIPAQHKHRRGLFGSSRVCTECQRLQAKMHHGVEVPPPPPLPGQVVSGGECASCGSHTQVLASHSNITVSPGMPAMPGMAPAPAPGMAAVGGQEVGYAAVGDGPAPIGAFEERVAAGVPARGPAAGLRDGAVMASSYAPTAVKPAGANRPHVLSHLLGVSGIGREGREARARRREEVHAAISYGAQAPVVDALPAKAVYGR